MLAAFAPALLHFGATSADAVYLTLGLLAAIPLLVQAGPCARRARARRRLACSPGRCSPSPPGRRSSSLARDGLRPALELAAITGAVLLAFHALFALATGFDPLGTLHATSRVYELGIASRRPYAYWLFGSPTAFLLILGAPIAWLALTAAGARRRPRRSRSPP